MARHPPRGAALTAPTSDLTLLGTGVVAALLVAHPVTWRRVRLGVTVVHEAGHALVAVLVGRRLTGIRLHSDTSGLTLSRGRPTGPGMVAMLAAGYLAPSVVGLGATVLLALDRPLLLLWSLVAGLASMLLWVRNGYGLLIVLMLGTALGLVGHYAAPPVATGAAGLVAWLLLLSAPRPLLELARSRRARHGSDVDQLARVTHLPAVLHLGVLLLLTVTAAVAGGVMLLPEAGEWLAQMARQRLGGLG